MPGPSQNQNYQGQNQNFQSLNMGLQGQDQVQWNQQGFGTGSQRNMNMQGPPQQLQQQPTSALAGMLRRQASYT